MAKPSGTVERPRIEMSFTERELERIKIALEMDNQGRGRHENRDLIQLIDEAMDTNSS